MAQVTEVGSDRKAATEIRGIAGGARRKLGRILVCFCLVLFDIANI